MNTVARVALASERRAGTIAFLRAGFHASMPAVVVKHALTISGHRFRLRPVELSDAEFIVALRTDPRRSQFLHPISPHVPDQVAWLQAYFERSGDYYFIIERLADHTRQGTVGLYDVDDARQSAEWGRWVAQVGSHAGTEGLLLIYRLAFELLQLDVVYARTIAAHQRALAIHSAYGLTPGQLLRDHVQLGARAYDAVEHRLTRAAWPTHEAELTKLVLGARGGHG